MGRHELASLAAVFGVLASTAACWADSGTVRPRDASPGPVFGLASATTLSSTLARADVAAMRSVVQPNLLKGGFGEAHMNRHLVGYLKQTGKWLPVPARLGPQGIDGLLVRYDGAGNPIGLIVSEAKYGASRLGMTSDGIQMGTRWRSIRLARMASEYRSIAASVRSGKMPIAGPGGSVGRQRLQIPLGDGRKVAVFARSRLGDPWEFVGPRSLMDQAGRQSELLGRYLQLASDGKVSYESPVYRVALTNNEMRVTVKDASLLGEQTRESTLPVQKMIRLPVGAERLEQLRALSQAEIARMIRQKYPFMTALDVDQYSRQIVRTTKDFEKLLSSRPINSSATVAWDSLKFGGAMAAIDIALQAVLQFRETGIVNWKRVGTSGAIAMVGPAAGRGIGEGVVILMTKNPVVYQFMQRTSDLLGIGSRSLATNIVGGTIGGGVATVFLAYGGYFAGLYDLQTANRMAFPGGAGVLAGAAFYAGATSLIAAFGAASTGTAISSLGGIAATNATLAWFGGGSLAAGGFGMAGGSVVLTGGLTLVVIGTGVAVYAVFHYSDEKQDLKRIRLTLNDLLGRTSFSLRGPGSLRFQSVTIGQDQGH
jgi:hypothetical protein